MFVTENLLRGISSNTTLDMENSNPLEVREKLFKLQAYYESKVADVKFAIDDLNVMMDNTEKFKSMGISPEEYPIHIKNIDEIFRDHDIDLNILE